MRRSLPILITGTMLFSGWLTPLAQAGSSAGIEVRPGTRATVTHEDGNDTRGPLDLSGVSIAQGSRKDQVFTLTTISPYTIGDITVGPNAVAGNFFIGIDTNNDRKLNYRLYLYNRNGLRAVLLKGDHVLRGVKVSRPNHHSIQAKVSLSIIGDPKNYWVLAASASATGAGCSQQRQCLDYIPNRYPLILDDVTPPVISDVNIPSVATDTTYSVSFTVADVGDGSGIKTWTVQENVGGSWTDVVSGGSSGAVNAQVPSAEGTVDELRVVATDGADNVTVTNPQTVYVPFDDSGAGVVYTHPGVDWSHPSSVDAYQGASHLSTGAGSTVSFSFTGQSLCIFGGPGASELGSAQLAIDADPVQVISEGPFTPARALLGCLGATSAGSHTVTMTVTTDDVFNFDGFMGI